MRFTRFVANDQRGSAVIFGRLFFRVFPIVKPIKKVCFNDVKDNLEYVIVKVVGHVDVSRIGCRVVVV
jgi:hypothetical protein